MSVMKTVERWYSSRVERDVTLVRWGHYGTPVLVFPTAGGDAEEIERMHLVGACAELIDEGRIKLYSCDSVAGRVMVDGDGDFTFRARILDQFQQMIAEEMVPAIHSDCGAPLSVVAAGASIGAFNALAAQCRYPWLFRTSICMSGSYRLQRFLGGEHSPSCTCRRRWTTCPISTDRYWTGCVRASSCWPPVRAPGRTSANPGR